MMHKFFSTILLYTAGALTCYGQSATIKLSGIKADHKLEHYYIKNVIDSRENKNGIGRINEGSIDLDGGLANGLEQYIKENVDQNKDGLPLNMVIRRFDIKEKAVGSKRQFDLGMTISYYSGSAKLVEYSGSSFAQSNSEANSYIDKLIRNNVTDNMHQFDAWVGKNKNTIVTEPTVNVQVNFARTIDKEDQIIYSKNRKLFISDFEGKPDENIIGAAATLSGIYMNYQSSTLRNKTDVKVTVSIYFDKSRSWMKDNGKNATTLMHEQRHFDITAIKACELKEKIENTAFSPADYKEQLSRMLDNAQEEGAAMQNAYDEETEHGTIIDKQEAWNKKIDELLSRQKCY